MKRFTMTALTVASLLLASVGYAEEVCKSKACAEKCDGECPINAAMKQLPHMTYQVGTESVCCPSAAAEIAKKNNSEVQFVVAKNVFSDESKAKLALTEATESFVANFAKPKTCNVSGKTTVAGKELCCSATAAQTAKLVKAAMDKVNVTYLVGDKECHCPNEAKAIAAKTNAETLFVVAGEKTCCSVSNRLNLARAKYKAAVEALVTAEKKTETKES